GLAAGAEGPGGRDVLALAPRDLGLVLPLLGVEPRQVVVVGLLELLGVLLGEAVVLGLVAALGVVVEGAAGVGGDRVPLAEDVAPGDQRSRLMPERINLFEPGDDLPLEHFELLPGPLLAGFEGGIDGPAAVLVLAAAAALGGAELLGESGPPLVAAAGHGVLV